MEILSTPELQSLTVKDLKKTAKENCVSGYSKLRKAEIIALLKSKRRPTATKQTTDVPKPSRYEQVRLTDVPVAKKSPMTSRVAKKKEVSPIPSPKKSPIKIDLTKDTPSPKKKLSPKEKVSPKKSSVVENYTRKVGPPEDREKYGLIRRLGAGEFGETYQARNLNKKKGEVDNYAIKIIKEYKGNKLDWIKEVECLIDIYEICSLVGILCYHESFIYKNGQSKEYIIVTELLDGYVALGDYLYDKNKKPLLMQRIMTDIPGLTMNKKQMEAEKIAENIYSQVVEVKNALTSLCINHSDLHFYNIMYNPKSKKIKVIDLGRCQTPQEEIKEWGDKNSEKWKLYSDDARIQQLRQALYNSIENKPHIFTYVNDNVIKKKEYFARHIVDEAKENCVRKKGPEDKLPKFM